ncbi:EMG1/NEP1 methyltransferase [Babesia microti strain RI]|uniref:EMG1/NEP1 methyltransferase n=1 Tax=Babesia microti (strain RI) TaxID=1133968 RepID=I7I9N1_BABMR|nr:EMG1/NEP1 methyltransferase [Babesia microti strain RI]CCF75329.1 EMG1/NEP1 methyltransferase [Babesia microti strain RI]|eukprot:XP_012649737.1 EMG1/NEP1 methyltransferase [Babesia microti strain RI]
MTNNLELRRPINVILTNAHIYQLSHNNTDNTNRNGKRYFKIYKNGVNNNKYNIEDEEDTFSTEFRPDILFFSLLALQDSIVNMKKLLNVFIITNDKLVIRVSNIFRIPRTYNLFLKVINMLFNSENRILKASESDDILLEILPKPLSDYVTNGTNINITDEGFLVDLRKLLISKSDVINNISFTFYINAGPDMPYNIIADECKIDDYRNKKSLSIEEQKLIKLINGSESIVNDNENSVNISLSKINLTASAKCFKLVCDLEHVFNL